MRIEKSILSHRQRHSWFVPRNPFKTQRLLIVNLCDVWLWSLPQTIKPYYVGVNGDGSNGTWQTFIKIKPECEHPWTDIDTHTHKSLMCHCIIRQNMLNQTFQCLLITHHVCASRNSLSLPLDIITVEYAHVRRTSTLDTVDKHWYTSTWLLFQNNESQCDSHRWLKSIVCLVFHCHFRQRTSHVWLVLTHSFDTHIGPIHYTNTRSHTHTHNRYAINKILIYFAGRWNYSVELFAKFIYKILTLLPWPPNA